MKPLRSNQDGEKDLAYAFGEMVKFVSNCHNNGSPKNNPPSFSYLLTPKQFDTIKKICKTNGWEEINCSGITIDYNAISHPLQSRKKDNLSTSEIEEIIISAYNPNSIMALNEKRTMENRDRQAIILNNQKKIMINKQIYYAMAILKIEKKEDMVYLKPVTCYQADEKKKRSITSRS